MLCITSISFSKKLAIFQHLTKEAGVVQPLETESSVAVSKTSDALLNGTPTSSPSLLAEMAMSWLCHFSVVTPRDNTHK